MAAMEDLDGNLQVACLSGIPDLQRLCQRENVKLSPETNRYLVYQMLKKVGPLMAQKLFSKLVRSADILWDSNEDFEVERIMDHSVDDSITYYLIKWKGWSSEFNTWEPENNLKCPEIMDSYHKSRAVTSFLSEKRPAEEPISMQESKRKRVDEIFEKLFKSPVREKITPLQIFSLSSPQKGSSSQIIKGLMTCSGRPFRFRKAPNFSNTKSKSYKQKKALALATLKEWEHKLNSVCTDPAPIRVVNDVDLEGPPENFEYINDYKAGEGITIPQDPLVGCECTDCYDERKGCCPAKCGTQFAFYRGKRVRVPTGVPIYECNKRCHCSSECPNRVVQLGRKFKVCVFRTANGRGWGVKTLQKIKRGSFVMEYVGEVITSEEAERRGKIYDAEGRTYLFDLDYNDGDCPFTVDAGYYGNVSHFVNHSCDPNLEVFGVWINTLDPRLPRIALFAKRDIARNEELTFDYMMTVDASQQTLSLTPTADETETIILDSKPEAQQQYRIVCQCGAENCRKYLF